MFKAIRFLLTDATVTASRARAWTASVALAAGAFGLVFFFPVNETTTARGVVWPVDDAMVRASVDCIVTEAAVRTGDSVATGDLLLTCDDEVAAARMHDLEAEVAAARARVFSTKDRVERSLRQESLKTATSMLELAKRDAAATRVRAQAAGVFHAHNPHNIVGRFFAEGEIIGYVLRPDNLAVRSMLAQDRASLVSNRTSAVALAMPASPAKQFASRVLRQVPAATFDIAAPALAATGGGNLLVTETGNGTRLVEAAFEVELALPAELRGSLVGEPIQVRFDHGQGTLASILAREIRLLFLRQFDV